jgi:hypothetical protein
MNTNGDTTSAYIARLLKSGVELSDIRIIQLAPDTAPADLREAMTLADIAAQKQYGEVMLLSWYDRDRDFESPQHSTECHLDSAVPGYVDYGISHGAKLMIVIQDGRFVFFYMPVTL